MKKLKTFVFYLLSFTNGLLMSSIGMVVSIVLILTGNKPKFFHNRIYFEVGYNWGGVNLGFVFLVNKYSLEETKQHECGHGIQNMVLGVLMPFVVSIPSAVRYWIFEFAEKGKLFEYELGLLSIEMVLIIVSIIILHYLYIIAFSMIVSLAIYWCVICTWVIFVEGKKYNKKPYPYYESIWFEKQATMLGKKYF